MNKLVLGNPEMMPNARTKGREMVVDCTLIDILTNAAHEDCFLGLSAFFHDGGGQEAIEQSDQSKYYNYKFIDTIMV